MEQKEDGNVKPPVSCRQAEALLAEYHGTVRAYREAVAALDADLPHQEFEAAHRHAERARTIFEQRREELLQHSYLHGCQAEPN
jgi:hypothetical protein